MKRINSGLLALLLAAAMLLTAFTACGSSRDPDVSNMIYLDEVNFETQEVAEAYLTAKGVSYTAVDAGATSGGYLAKVMVDYLYLRKSKSGYYVNKDETVVVKVFTYEPAPDIEPENTPDDALTETPFDFPASTLPPDVPDSNNSDGADDSGTVFEPKDVTDETIKSIRTYDDYLAMYRAIIEDYYASYELVIKDTILYSEEAFANMKKQYDDSFEQQKDTYGAMGKSLIIGKDSIVEFLIRYRDGLKEAIDRIAESLG